MYLSREDKWLYLVAKWEFLFSCVLCEEELMTPMNGVNCRISLGVDVVVSGHDCLSHHVSASVTRRTNEHLLQQRLEVSYPRTERNTVQN